MSTDVFLIGHNDVSIKDKEFVAVKAEGPEEAFEIYVRQVLIRDSFYHESAYSKSMYDGFSEIFWFQTKEEKDRQRFEDEVIATEEQFNARVREFFGPHADYAEAYLAYYWDDDIEEPKPGSPGPFSDEMLTYIVKEDFREGYTVMPLWEIPFYDGTKTS